MDTKVNNSGFDQKKARASAWFSEVRDRLVAALEALEGALPAGAPMERNSSTRWATR